MFKYDEKNNISIYTKECPIGGIFLFCPKEKKRDKGCQMEAMIHVDTVKNHVERIGILEKRIEKVENNYVNLENNILKGNQAQQEFFRDTLNKQWEHTVR